jgi:sulfoxide reductase heme-binding subunit YedZ
MVKRLGGKQWQRLHRLIYLVGILGVIHFWMIVKSDIFYPAMFGLVLLVLLGYRVYSRAKPKLATRRSTA